MVPAESPHLSLAAYLLMELPPLVVFTGKAVQPGWAPKDDIPMYAATENGWMWNVHFTIG